MKNRIGSHTKCALIISFGLSACTPNCPLAKATCLPEEAIEEAIETVKQDPIFDPNDNIPENWWTLFKDEQLNRFVETALIRNPTIHEAQANILLAIANANRVRANLFPNIDWGLDVSSQKFSETGIIPFNVNPGPGNTPFAATGGVNGIPVYFTQYETEFTLKYDFDFWGKNRNTWKAFLNILQARIADEAFLRLELGIAVSEVYFDLLISYKRESIAKAIVDNRSEYLDYIKRRVQANVDNALSLSFAEINLASAKQNLLKIQADIAVQENLLRSYLAGCFNEEIFHLDIFAMDLPKVPLPENIPLHLISRRPDIIAQLWLIESAGKQIEVAKAGFYPDFNLTALFGFQTIHFPEWFRLASFFYNIDPAVTLPVFDGGRLNANLRASEANYDLAIFKYNELVINSAKEVLDGLMVLKNSHQQLQEFQIATDYQEQYYRLTSLRKEHNLNSTLDTLISEGNLLITQDQEVIALRNTIRAMLALIKALGGGYEVCDLGGIENECAP